MKKAALVLLLVLAMLTPLDSLARTQYMNIVELREQTPARWAQSYKTKWRTVEVDAAVTLPDTDAIPIVKVTHGVPGIVPTLEESGWAEVERRYDSLVLYNGWKQAPKSVGGKRINQNAEAKGTWRSGFAPESKYVPMSDIPYGEICGMIRENLSGFGYDPGQFALETPTEMWAQHWFLYGYKKDALPGQILLHARQKLNGLPIFHHIQEAVRDHYHGESRTDEMWARFGLSSGYDAYGEKLSHLYVTAAQPIETLAEDVPLCAFDKVVVAIEPGISAGHIRKIYEVELGYVIYNEPGVYFSRKEPLVEGRTPPKELEEASAKREEELEAARYYLRPMWQVNCLWVRSPGGKLRETASYTTDERNTLDYRQLLVDAQTGELVQESTAQDRCEFKGFISWDEVDRKH
ncbi:MAG: hypothetical protein VB099_17885 [Candidatus Limiplasma sp.]|nr:hypothetical protein [Candidatus Limiplasma sp.]